MTGPTAHGLPIYSCTQIGWWLLAALGATLLMILVLLTALNFGHSLARAETRAISGLVIGVLLVTAALFSTMTVRIDGDTLAWRFGPGLLRFSIPLSEIDSASPTRTSLLAGIGIHWMGSGWVYNVSGRDAVEITRRDGRKVWIGTPEPAVLAAAIERARGTPASPGATRR